MTADARGRPATQPAALLAALAAVLSGCVDEDGARFEVPPGATLAEAACGLGPEGAPLALDDGRVWLSFTATELLAHGDCVEAANGAAAEGSDRAVEEEQGAEGLFVTWSDDGGESWRRYQRLSDGRSSGGTFGLSAASGERFAVVGSSGDSVVLHRTLDGGVSWEDPVVRAVADSNGPVAVGWTEAGVVVVAEGQEGLVILRELDDFTPSDPVPGDGFGVDAAAGRDVDLTFEGDTLLRVVGRDLSSGDAEWDWEPPPELAVNDWVPGRMLGWPTEQGAIVLGVRWSDAPSDPWWPQACVPFVLDSTGGLLEHGEWPDAPCSAAEHQGGAPGGAWTTWGTPLEASLDVTGWRVVVGWPASPLVLDVPFPRSDELPAPAPHGVALEDGLGYLLGQGQLHELRW